MSKPSFVYVAYIRSTPANVWRALTDPEVTQHYWVHRNVSDWTIGAAWDHRRCDGSNIIDITGTIVESVPPKHLVITWALPGEAADPQKVSRVTFDIEPHKEDSVRLTVTHDHLQPGSAMERGITQGWPLVLSALKSWLETGKALPL
jgi:uncharacterized protein YndB with AHSA1/START domain